MKKRRFLSALLALVTAAGTAIGVTGAASAADSSPYKDVKTKRWSYPEIIYATENGYMNGMGGGYFEPEGTMTRAMVVTVLYRMQGEPTVTYQSFFEDVKAKDWYSTAVVWAAKTEIVNGVSDGVFAPMENVTRQQLAAILTRYASLEYIKTDERKNITGYKDYKKVQAYARDAMSWANAMGLITGVTDSTLEPASFATREQFAVILKRFRENDKFSYELAYKSPTYNSEINRDYALVTDADIYVAVDGNDANAGTIDKPIATFERAKEMVRELKKTAKDEIKVAFKAGNYGELDNITFTADDAGSEDVPITYCAYGDGEVIFSNGILISEDEFCDITDSEKQLFPEKARDSIKKVDLSGRVDKLKYSNYVFSETGVCHEARYPNKSGYTDVYITNFTTRVEEEGKEEYEYDKLLLQVVAAKVCDSFSTVDGMKITGMLRTGWLHDTFAVKSYDKETKILTLDYENSGFENGYSLRDFPLAFEGRMDDTIFFHNLAELLDSENEYWFDESTKQLYFYEPSGEYAIGTGGTFMTLQSGADHISFVGLSFKATTENAIVSQASDTTFRLCVFGNLGGKEVIKMNHVKNILITECEFYNFVDSAIDLSNKGLNYKWTLTCANNVITNNYLHDFILPQYFSSAVSLTHEVGTVVSHNVFKNGAHDAMDYGNCVDLVIEYNVFDNLGTMTIDLGAVATWQSVANRGNKVRYNLFCNIESKGGVYGIYFDDNTCGQEVYGNLFYNAGDHAVTLNGGRDNELHDNIIVSEDSDNDFLMSNGGIYTLIEEGTPEKYTEHAFWTFLNSQIVREGEGAYDEWREKWPIMYEYTTDPADIGDVKCIFTIVNYVMRNAMIGSDDDFGGMYEKFAVKEGNRVFEITENPFFADPTHGDYTLVGDTSMFDSDYLFDFAKVGIEK